LTAQQNDQRIDASSNCSRFVIANQGEAIQLMFGCSCDCPTRVLNQPARPSPDTSWIASLSLAMTEPGLSSRACEAIQLMFGCSRLCSTRVLNQPARPSPDISWIASLSLGMTVDDWVSYRSDAFHNLASPVMELASTLRVIPSEFVSPCLYFLPTPMGC
jgi:hypothetical protein